MSPARVVVQFELAGTSGVATKNDRYLTLDVYGVCFKIVSESPRVFTRYFCFVVPPGAILSDDTIDGLKARIDEIVTWTAVRKQQGRIPLGAVLREARVQNRFA